MCLPYYCIAPDSWWGPLQCQACMMTLMLCARFHDGKRWHRIHTMSCHSMPCQTIPCHSMPCHDIPCHSMPCHAIPCHVLLFHALPCHTMPSHSILCHAKPCLPSHAIPRHAKPSQAMPCQAKPCHAKPYDAMAWHDGLGGHACMWGNAVVVGPAWWALSDVMMATRYGKHMRVCMYGGACMRWCMAGCCVSGWTDDGLRYSSTVRCRRRVGLIL